MMQRLRRPLWAFLICGLLLLAGCADGVSQPGVEEAPSASEAASLAEPPAEPLPAGAIRQRTVYVPAYSHLPRTSKPYKSLLSILLSVRNLDSTSTATLTHVDYFDTSGHRVRRYLSAPRALRPLETAEFVVTADDEAGGSGANFLVNWEGPSDAHPLLTESVMWGHMGAGFVSFASRGVELERRPDPKAFLRDEPEVEPSGSPQGEQGE